MPDFPARETWLEDLLKPFWEGKTDIPLAIYLVQKIPDGSMGILKTYLPVAEVEAIASSRTPTEVKRHEMGQQSDYKASDITKAVVASGKEYGVPRNVMILSYQRTFDPCRRTCVAIHETRHHLQNLVALTESDREYCELDANVFSWRMIRSVFGDRLGTKLWGDYGDNTLPISNLDSAGVWARENLNTNWRPLAVRVLAYRGERMPEEIRLKE